MGPGSWSWNCICKSATKTRRMVSVLAKNAIEAAKTEKEVEVWWTVEEEET